MTTLDKTSIIIFAILSMNEKVLSHVFNPDPKDDLSISGNVYHVWKTFWEKGVSASSRRLLHEAGIYEVGDLMGLVKLRLLTRRPDTLKSIQQSIFGYTRTIASNILLAAIDQKRNQSLYEYVQNTSDSLSDTLNDDTTVTLEEKLASQAASDELSTEQCVSRLMECAEGLDERTKTIIYMSVVEDRPSNEICAAISMTAGNVYTKKHRALKKHIAPRYTDNYMD